MKLPIHRGRGPLVVVTRVAALLLLVLSFLTFSPNDSTERIGEGRFLPTYILDSIPGPPSYPGVTAQSHTAPDPGPQDCENNLPPVAIMQDPFEWYTYLQTEVSASDSYDPDGYIVKKFFKGGGTRGDLSTTDMAFSTAGEWPVSVTVTDNCGAEGRDTIMIRIIEYTNNSDRTSYGLQGECAATGAYWNVVPDVSCVDSALAVGGKAASLTSPPPDLPENQLRFVIPDVVSADTGRYYLSGGFASTQKEGNCIWVRINGGQWYLWNIIQKSQSFYPGPPFSLGVGDNTVDLAYCSPELGVDWLRVGADTGSGSRYYYLIDDPSLVSIGCNNQAEIGEYWLEAECGQVGSGWMKIGDEAASNSTYVEWRRSSAYGGPPADVPENYIRFRTEIAVPGSYHLQARINAPDPLSDSYYIRVNEGDWLPWTSGIKKGAGFTWNLYSASSFPLNVGENTVDFAYRERGTQLDRIYLGPITGTITGRGDQRQSCSGLNTSKITWFFDVTCTQYGAAWTPRSDPNTSSGAYLVALTGNSLSAPPPEVPENIISFDFGLGGRIPEKGRLNLFANINAPTPDDNSFYIKVNRAPWYPWKLPVTGSRQFEWNRLPFVIRNYLTTGPNTIKFAFRENGTKLDRVVVTTEDTLPQVNPPDTRCAFLGNETRVWEAECSALGNGWDAPKSELTSGYGYVTFTGPRQLHPPSGTDLDHILEYKADVGRATNDYRLYLRLDAPDPGRNSVWVQIGDGPWIKMWQEIGGAQLLTNGFEWREVNDNGVPLVPSLIAGDVTIRIANREPGTRIDKIYLALDAPPPFGFGLAAETCMDATSPSFAATPHVMVRTPVERLTGISLYPNPVTEVLTLKKVSPYMGPVDVLVYNSHGRRVLQTRYEKETDLLQRNLDVANLPAGVYRMQVLEGDVRTVKTFVRR